MRLVDADKFERDLSSVWEWLVKREIEGCGTTHGESLDKVHDILMSQPTAYDVDKVVEELKKLQTEAFSYAFKYNDDFYNGQSNGLRVAIEIVKEGGVENDI